MKEVRVIERAGGDLKDCELIGRIKEIKGRSTQGLAFLVAYI